MTAARALVAAPWGPVLDREALVCEDEIEQRAQLTRGRRGLSHRPQGFGCSHCGLQRLGWRRLAAGADRHRLSVPSGTRGERGVLGERVEAVPPTEMLQLASLASSALTRARTEERAPERGKLPMRRAQEIDGGRAIARRRDDKREHHVERRREWLPGQRERVESLIRLTGTGEHGTRQVEIR